MKQLDNIDEADICFVDIETARVEKDLIKGSPLYEAWKYKARYQNEMNKKTGAEFTLEEYYYEKAPLYAPFGKVVAIVVGRIKDNRIYLKSYASYDEKELLEEFNNDLNLVYGKNPKTRFCTFNGIGYDIPFMEKRLTVYGIRPCPLLCESGDKPWLLSHLDLSNIWKGNAFYPDSLLAVATALGLPSPKDGLDGSGVSEAFWTGQLPLIAEYCLKDVETTCRVFRKMSFKPDLEEGFEIIGGKIEVAEIPLLERIYKSSQISDTDKDELRGLLSKKKIPKKEMVMVEEILTRLYVNCAMFQSDKDDVVKRKQAEIKELLQSL